MQDTGYKRPFVIGLCVDCPSLFALDECSLKELRKYPLKERFELVRNLSEPDLDEIIRQHNHCLKKRTAALINHTQRQDTLL